VKQNVIETRIIDILINCSCNKQVWFVSNDLSLRKEPDIELCDVDGVSLTFTMSEEMGNLSITLTLGRGQILHFFNDLESKG
jgi:hypothetical protein